MSVLTKTEKSPIYNYVNSTTPLKRVLNWMLKVGSIKRKENSKRKCWEHEERREEQIILHGGIRKYFFVIPRNFLSVM